MNYGKTAYLKVLDLEKELLYSKNTSVYKNCYLELHKPNLNQTFTSLNEYISTYPAITVTTNSPLCFQIKSTINAINTGEIGVEIIIDETLIYEETKSISPGENDIVLFKTFSPIASGELELKIRFYAITENYTATIKSISLVVLGADGDNITTDIEMRATLVPYQNKILISYIDSGKLYYTFEPLSEKSLKQENFTYLLPATSHCFTLECFASETIPEPNILLYRVDSDGNLYFSNVFNGEIETFIDDGVSCVFACPCPKISDDSNIVTYIKNGECFFRTMRKGNILAEKKLVLPSGSYKDIHVINHEDSDYLYIIASHSNGSNYIIRSLVEVSTGKIVEILYSKYDIAITSYIDLECVMHGNNNEHLNLSFECLVKPFIDTDSLFENVCHDNISLTYSLSPSKYILDFDALYGVKLEKSSLKPGEWESYTDDAETFEGAYMDFNNNVFVDNGWQDRWPYTFIKPCLMLDGKVVGYLNPNNYAQFEDGTKATINKAASGQVMIEFPKVYYKISQDDNYYYVQITNKPREGFTDAAFWRNGVEYEKIYIAAYFGGTNSFKSQGFSSISSSLINYISACGYEIAYPYLEKFHGEGYEIMPFKVWQLLQVLYLIMFKNTNSQSALGYGYGAYRQRTITGSMNTYGMYYGASGTSQSVKCFGLEHFYGAKNTLTPGFYIDSEGRPRYLDPTKEGSSYKPDYISNYEVYSGVTYDNQISLANHYILGDNDLGFIGTSATNDFESGFCDGCKLIKNTVCSACGSVDSIEIHGVFGLATINANSTTASNAIRLVYYPQ